MATYELTTPDGKVYEIETPNSMVYTRSEYINHEEGTRDKSVLIFSPSTETMDSLAQTVVKARHGGTVKDGALTGLKVRYDSEPYFENYTNREVSAVNGTLATDPSSPIATKHEIGHALNYLNKKKFSQDESQMSEEQGSGTKAYISPMSHETLGNLNGVLRSAPDLFGLFASDLKKVSSREELDTMIADWVGGDSKLQSVWAIGNAFTPAYDTKVSKDPEKALAQRDELSRAFTQYVLPHLLHRTKPNEVAADFAADPVATITRLNRLLKYVDPNKKPRLISRESAIK